MQRRRNGAARMPDANGRVGGGRHPVRGAGRAGWLLSRPDEYGYIAAPLRRIGVQALLLVSIEIMGATRPKSSTAVLP